MESKSSSLASCSASRTLVVKTSHGTTVAIAEKGSDPFSFASINAEPTLAYSRSFSLMALPAAAKVFSCLFFALVKKDPIMRSWRSRISSVSVAVASTKNGHQCGVTAFNLILLQLEDFGLSAFSSQMQQPILMNLPTGVDRDPDGPDLQKPFYMK